MSDNEQWLRGPALEIIIQMRALEVGDEVEQTPNEGNKNHAGDPPRIDAVRVTHPEAYYTYYGKSIRGPHYPSGWSLTGWRRPKKEPHE